MKKYLLIPIITLLVLTAGCWKEETKEEPEPDYFNKNIYVTTFSGVGTLGYLDGENEKAQYAFPTGVTQADDGTLYISDTYNHRIRAISPDGNVTTIAGKADEKNAYGLLTGGFEDGPALEAAFNQPRGLAIGQDGTIYIADSKNGAIRYIVKDEVKTLIQDLSHPSDIVIDSEGNLLVSETLSHKVLKITPDGTMSVFAGGEYKQQDEWYIGEYKNGSRLEAKFNEPTGLALSSDGVLYIADSGNQRIRAIDTEGNVTTYAGSGNEFIPGSNYYAGGFADGAANKAKFNFPSAIAIDSEGRLFITDTYNHSIRVITNENIVKTIAGVSTNHGRQDGNAEEAQFDGPTDLIFDQNGHLIITEQWNNIIRSIQID
jgi:sugar lactone lactonase YvrE